MDSDRMTKRVWETTGRTRDKTGTKRAVKLRKDWTEMKITVKIKENQGKNRLGENQRERMGEKEGDESVLGGDEKERNHSRVTAAL